MADTLDYLDEYDPSRGARFHHHLIAGSVAGLAEHGLMFPLDTIKTMSQCDRTCGVQKPPDVFCVRAAKQLVRGGGARLWRGVGAVAVACGPAHAVYFGSFEAVRAAGGDAFLVNGFAGCVAAIGHDVVMTPADVAKQRLQLGYHASLLDCVRDVARKGGLAALYRSLPTTLAMNAPYGSISVAVNESLKTRWRRSASTTSDRGSVDLPVHALLASGGLAGAVASLATTPLDVVKTRLQTQGLAAVGVPSSSSDGPGRRRRHLRYLHRRSFYTSSSFKKAKKRAKQQRASWWSRAARLSSTTAAAAAAAATTSTTVVEGNPLKYRGFLDAALAVWREDGPRGFLRGAGVRALAQAPSVAIVWTTYELLIKLLSSAPPGKGPR